MNRLGTVMTRSFAEALGVRWPKDLAAIVDGRRVTWREVHARRTAEQNRRLAWKRRPDRALPVFAYVWVFFNRFWLYHGWYTYLVWIEDGRVHDVCVNFQGYRVKLAESLMHAFPMGFLPLGRSEDVFERWMEAFAKAHPRRKTKKDPRRAGLAFVRWDRAADSMTRVATRWEKFDQTVEAASMAASKSIREAKQA